jgi:hypothetical protein
MMIEVTAAAGVRNSAGRIGASLLLGLPVILFAGKFAIIDHAAGLSGDWGYFLQIYEAARRSILDYGQFPWWNAWSLGGVPLYANPQFGLVSIQMPLVLLFGTLAGLRLSVLAYMLLGFAGMYRLLKRLGAPGTAAPALLAYIWVFSSYPVLHIYVGHLTFANYLLAPWFLLTLLDIERPYGWLWFGLVTAFLINQAPHYATIQMLAVGASVLLVRLLRRPAGVRPLKRLKPYLLAACVILALTAHKLFFTIDYLNDYPRFIEADDATPVRLLWAGLTQRRPPDGQLAGAAYGWHEYGAYPSILTLGLFVYAACSALKNRTLGRDGALLLGAAATGLLLSLGAFAWFSPYALLHHLPVFGQMRVPSRWLGWTILAMILFLTRLPNSRIAVPLLGLACLDLFVLNFGILNAAEPRYLPPQPMPRFEQFAFRTSAQPEDMRPFESTQANAGEIFGYEPIANFYPGSPVAQMRSLTNRCGVNEGCGFVLSGNARLVAWTPQRILLQRTGPGGVLLNMNPGRWWTVNGARPFGSMRLFELKKPFLIEDASRTIVVELSP